MKSRTAMLAAVLATALSGAAMADTYRYNTYAAPTDPTVVEGVFPFVEKLKELTNGEVSFEVFTGGQLAKATEILGAIRDGVIDAGFVYEPYHPNLLPSQALLGEMIAYHQNPLATAAAMMETILLDCENCRKEFDASNAMVISGHAVSTQYFVCRMPINTVEEMKGLRIRSPQPFTAAVTNALGATVVNLPFTEMVAAMERGTIDCINAGIYLVKTLGLQDIAKSVITALPLGSTTGSAAITISKDVWSRFSDEQKRSVLRAAADYAAKASVATARRSAEDLQELKDKIGFEQSSPDGFKAVWGDFLETERERILKAGAEIGTPEPEKLVDTYLANYAEWEKLVADIGFDSDRLAELLWERVYSKVKF